VVRSTNSEVRSVAEIVVMDWPPRTCHCIEPAPFIVPDDCRERQGRADIIEPPNGVWPWPWQSRRAGLVVI
jgi:hypothetical protein